jgi:hypothetical protein
MSTLAGAAGFSAGLSAALSSGFFSSRLSVSIAEASASLRAASGDLTSRRSGTATICVGFA